MLKDRALNKDSDENINNDNNKNNDNTSNYLDNYNSNSNSSEDSCEPGSCNTASTDDVSVRKQTRSSRWESCMACYTEGPPTLHIKGFVKS